MDKGFFEEAERCANLDSAAALLEIKRLELLTDGLAAKGRISQEEAWDRYFGLMHECDERGLLDDFRRLSSKINKRLYNPFKSRNPNIRLLAAIRLGARASREKTS